MLVHPISFHGELVGFIFIQSDLERLIERLERYVVIAGIVLAVSLLVALFVSRIASRTIADPVMNLAESARRVTRDKSYAVRVSTGNAEGELATLVETFNEMLGQIEERDRTLQFANDQLEQRVRQRTDQLQAANKELESFSYSVSHDLRGPLRTIDGFSLALAEDHRDKLDSQALDYIQRIRNATQRMGTLIDDLLNLSRVTRSEMHRQRVDLSAMARSLAAELVANDHGRQVEWVIANGIEASGDSRLLQIVMDNLIGNAWKYTSKHDRGRIEFGQKQGNDGLVYFVKDDGAGFEQNYAGRLFGAFQRLHAMTEFPGTGVGLATVQRIIHRHGGLVWAEGAVEKGATFYFTLQAGGPT